MKLTSDGRARCTLKIYFKKRLRFVRSISYLFNIFNYTILCSNKALATCCLLLNPHVVIQFTYTESHYFYFFFSLVQKQGPMDSSQRLFQFLVNKFSFLALTVILTFLNKSFPTSLEKKNQDGFEDSYFGTVFNST